jgi:hypothetical protein
MHCTALGRRRFSVEDILSVLAPWALPSAHLIFDIHRWQLTAAGAPPSTAPQTRSPYPSFSFVVSCSGSSRPPFVSSFQESTSSWRRHVLPVRCMPRRAQSQIQANDRAPGALHHPLSFHRPSASPRFQWSSERCTVQIRCFKSEILWEGYIHSRWHIPHELQAAEPLPTLRGQGFLTGLAALGGSI